MATYLQFSLRNEEIDDLLLYIHPIVADRCFHQPSVDAHHRMFGIFHLHFPGAIGVHAAMIQEAARYQKPDALNQLNHLGMVDHAHVEHAVIWYGIRRLAIAGTTADTDRHHLALNHDSILWKSITKSEEINDKVREPKRRRVCRRRFMMSAVMPIFRQFRK